MSVGGLVPAESMTDAQLDAIRARCKAASRAPWKSFVEGRDHESGDNFVMVGEGQDREADMYISRETKPASVADQDFIAGARQDIPALLAEIDRLRQHPDQV
jgi:hypothetical protein